LRAQGHSNGHGSHDCLPNRHHQHRSPLSPSNFGAIAPRFWADFIVFDDLKNFTIRQTYKKGVLVANQGKYLAPHPAPVPQPRSTMNLRYAAENLEVHLNRAAKIRVIEIVPNQIVTRQIIETPLTRDGQIVPDLDRDILKLVVVERHHSTGNVGVGFVAGSNSRLARSARRWLTTPTMWWWWGPTTVILPALSRNSNSCRAAKLRSARVKYQPNSPCPSPDLFRTDPSMK